MLHLPPGTSKWNKIEHRLFSAITMNWRGRPLVSHEVIIETISAVTTRTGLTVTAVLDTGIYPKGIRIPDKDMKAFEARHLQRHQFHGNWNYTIPATRPATRHARMMGINYCASAKATGSRRLRLQVSLIQH